MQNQARLKVLKAREEHIRSVLEEAKQKLIAITKDSSKYQGVVQKLIAQGLCLLTEKVGINTLRPVSLHFLSL